MASISGFSPTSSSSSALRPHRKWQKPLLTSPSPFSPLRSRRQIHSIAGDVSSHLSSSPPSRPLSIKPVEKDPINLWNRYVDWLYQHKDLGLFLDVSRIGFTDEFVARMEPRLQKAFEAMRELEKGAIANPDEGRMVGHYWLRNSDLAPNPFLKTQIERTLDAICRFADEIISGKVRVLELSCSRECYRVVKFGFDL